MINVTKNNINSVLSGDKLIVLFFSNPSCGPCKEVRILIGVEEKKHKGVVFANCNTHNEMEIATRYNIRSCPAIVFIKRNKVVGQIHGSEINLNQAISSHLRT